MPEGVEPSRPVFQTQAQTVSASDGDLLGSSGEEVKERGALNQENPPFDTPWPAHNITIIGQFNPGILSAQWVGRHILKQAPSQTALKVDGFRVVHRLGNVIWEPNRDRLIVRGPAEEIGEFAAKVLATLPHTPLTAAGVNLQLQGRISLPKLGPDRLDRSIAGVRELLDGTPVLTTLSEVVKRTDNVQLQLQVSFSGDDPGLGVLAFNYHLEPARDDESRRFSLIAEHVQRAPAFLSDAERISKAFFRE